MNKEQFQHAHSLCPMCGYDEIETTTAGVISTADGEYKDDVNTASCLNCSWDGMVMDLRPLNTSPMPEKSGGVWCFRTHEPGRRGTITKDKTGVVLIRMSNIAAREFVLQIFDQYNFTNNTPIELAIAGEFE